MSNEAAIRNPFVRRFRSVFVAPGVAERLGAELQVEMNLLQVRILFDHCRMTNIVVSKLLLAVDITQRVERLTTHDGEVNISLALEAETDKVYVQIRRLRASDVHVLEVLDERHTENGIVVWSRARVDSQVMATRGLRRYDDLDAWDGAEIAYIELARKLSYAIRAPSPRFFV